MAEVKGLNLKETFTECRLIEMEGISIRLIPFDFLNKGKKSAGRPKDLDGLEKRQPGK